MSKDGIAIEMELFVGARVKYKDAIGTVRYLGPLHDQGATEWAGVQWDNAARGKHSGTHDAHHYFTSTVPNAATFVKTAKLGTGGRTTFLQAARLRFADALDRSHRDHTMLVGGGVVDIADEGRIADQMSAVSVLDVSNLGIAVIVGGDGRKGGKALSTALPRLRDVCIARSLFTSVRAVIELLACLPTLRVIDASRNMLLHGSNDAKLHAGEEERNGSSTDIDTDTDTDTQTQTHGLTELILNHCVTDWHAIEAICDRAPNVQQIRLHNCMLPPVPDDTLSKLHAHWQHVQMLDLDRNKLTWHAVLQLASLPYLRELYVSGNVLPDTDVFHADKDNNLPFFPCLHTLSVSDNQIAGWCFITALHALPALQHVRVRGNAVASNGGGGGGMADGEYSWRQRVVGRIARLRRLDGSSISKDERLLADRRYTQEEIVPGVKLHGMRTVCETHPRAKELLGAHGDTVAKNGDVAVTRTLRPHVVQVVLVADDALTARRKQAVRWLPKAVGTERVRAVARRTLRVEEDVLFEMKACCKDGEDEVSVWLEDGRDLGVVGRIGLTSQVRVVCVPIVAGMEEGRPLAPNVSICGRT